MSKDAEVAYVDHFDRRAEGRPAGLAAGRTGGAPAGRARRDDTAGGRGPGHCRDRGRPGDATGQGLEVADAV